MLFGYPLLLQGKDPETEQIQYGRHLANICKSDDIYQFASTLDSQVADCSLISSLNKSCKNLLNGFTKTCQHTLCQLMAECATVGAYFASLPSIDGKGVRYSDWIGPYL